MKKSYQIANKEPFKKALPKLQLSLQRDTTLGFLEEFVTSSKLFSQNRSKGCNQDSEALKTGSDLGIFY
jgi:hypothetical protein